MRKIVASVVVLGLLLAAALTLPGCTGSNPVRPATSDVLFSAQISNPNATVFEGATIGIAQIRFRPVDPSSDAILGDVDFGLLPIRIPAVDLNATTVVTGEATVLNPGVYRLVDANFFPPSLVNNDPADENDPTAACEEKIALYPGTAANVPPLVVVDYSTDADPPTFTVSAGGASTLTVVMDSEAIIRSWTQVFDCRDKPILICPNAGGPGITIPTPCLDSYITSIDYGLILKDLVTFTQQPG